MIPIVLPGFATISHLDINQRFIRYRSGKPFMIVLAVFLATWFALKAIGWIIDAENGTLNLILSIEASVATSVLLDQSLRQAARDRDTLARIEAIASAEKPELDEILRILKK